MNSLFVISIAVAIVVIAVAFVIFHSVLFKKKKGHPSGKAADELVDTLNDAKLRSSIILDTIEDGVILIDSQNIIQLFNPGASHLTGWPVEEALNLDCNLVIKLVDNKDVAYTDEINPLSRVFKVGDTVRDNHANLVTRSNKRVAISISVSPLIDENKKITSAVAIFRDISKERKEEEQRTAFISTASHEMRTPVAAIEGYISLALNDKVTTIDSRARTYLDKAHNSTQYLGRLFQDLLTSEKAEDGRLSNHPTIVEMGSLLERLTEDTKFVAAKKDLLTEFAIGANTVIDTSSEQSGKVIKPLYYVYADATRLSEVFTNLFDNACKYTPTGKITIGLTGNNDVVQFFIKDTGAGIGVEDIPHLFQKFYRADNSATRTIGGTGLGLFICRRIIELYNGRIWVESELGKGSTFFINLPRLNDQQREKLEADELAQANSSLVSPTGS